VSAPRRKRPALVEGLEKGIEKADVVGMAGAIGEGLVRVSEAWLPKGKLAVPQMCPLNDGKGPYASTVALHQHLTMAHPGLGLRERSFVLDSARRSAVRQAMNGASR
jgi:hypothetical protein